MMKVPNHPSNNKDTFLVIIALFNGRLKSVIRIHSITFQIMVGLRAFWSYLVFMNYANNVHTF